MNIKTHVIRIFSVSALSAAFLLPTNIASADAIAGDKIITLGEDLTIAQQKTVFEKMGVDEKDAEIVYVSNEEEHKYLGSYIPEKQIGTKALSSALITMGESGSGLSVETSNISYISKEMYANALSTAGITDAQIYVTAPFKVSGTGALTGVIKAYEETTGNKIDEEQKQIANEEMVETAKLAEDVGAEKASEFVSTVKEKISEEKPETKEEIKNIIINVAGDLNFNLTDEQMNKFVDMFSKINELKIDWGTVNDKITSFAQSAKDKISQAASSDEAEQVGNFFTEFFKSVANWFKSLFN